MSGSTLPASVRRAVWRRQFLVQGCWNYEGMQNVGFAYSILPALKHIYADRPEDLTRAIKRHLEFFNTQPAMGSVILGAAVSLEQRVAAQEEDPRSIGTFKVGLMGTLGAIGDAYFWGALKPLASVAGAILAFIHPLLGIAALLAIYNFSHLIVRSRGFAAGIAGQEKAVEFLKGAGFKLRTEDRKTAAAVLGGIYGALGVAGAIGAGVSWLATVLCFAGAVLLVNLFTLMFRKAVSPSELLLLLLLVGLLLVRR
ncbi:MAG TPA: PTS system mannose/fructose/sorbose family transporter subunit IID [Candidatus Deferrimicrobiaceae bacterium]